MSRRRGSQGSLLIVTLWLVTILGALSVAVARYLSTEVRLTRYRLARQQARELARSGVWFALNVIQEDAATSMEDWSGEPWAIPQMISPAAGRQVTVTITDEERKLNLNTATAAQLSSLLGDDALAQAVVDDAKDGAIAILEQLNDLPDLTEDARALLHTTTTPYTAITQNGGPMNINTATRQAMLAYGLSEYTVNMIDEVRLAPNRKFEQPGDIMTILRGLNWAIAPLEQEVKEQALLNAMMTSSSVFRVLSEGVVESSGVRVRVEAVIQRSTDPTSPTPKIIAWREG